jgi:phosphoglycerate kinase
MLDSVPFLSAAPKSTDFSRRFLLRADLNVPVDEKGVVGDEHRLAVLAETISFLSDRGARVCIISHLGDPQPISSAQSLRTVADALARQVKRPVGFFEACIGPEAVARSKSMAPGEIVVFENLRAHAGEKANDRRFAQELSKLGDVYVNDAFASGHREHASLVTLPKLFAERFAGLLVERELNVYHRSLEQPKRPLCVVVGGAKVSTKLRMLERLSVTADKIIIGGAMANTFLAAQGLQMGRSLYEPELIPNALAILANLSRRDAKVYLPVDLVAASSIKDSEGARPVPAQEFPADLMALDIGPATVSLFKLAVLNCATVVWNGPMGAFEVEAFSHGTFGMVEGIAASHGFKVAGGGETDAAIHQMELGHKFDFLSSGGGAFLKLLEGSGLVALDALGG